MPLYYPPPNRLTFSSAVAVVRNSVNGAGDATAQTMATITIPGGAVGPNGLMNVIAEWSYTNSVNVKTIRGKIGGTGGTTFMTTGPTTTLSVNQFKKIANVNSNSSQKFMVAGIIGIAASTANALATSAIDTSAAFTIVLECLWAGAVAAENITLESYFIDVVYSA